MSSDGVQAQGQQPADELRKPYRAPRLVVHGSVRELTLGQGGASPDTTTKQKKTKTPPRSEPSTKQQIVRIGTHPLGIGLYLFEYKPGFGPQGRHFGVMADEVERVMPQAVSRDASGFRRVDHHLLGVEDLAPPPPH